MNHRRIASSQKKAGSGGAIVFPKANVVLSGHSFVAGADATRLGTTDHAARIKNSLDPTIFTFTAIGHGGFRTGHAGDGSGNQLFPLAPTEIDPLRKAGQVNFLLYEEVINSIGWYQTASGGSLDSFTATSTTIADYAAYLAARRAAGWTPANKAYIGACTMYPVAYFPTIPIFPANQDYRQSCRDVNAAIRSGLDLDFLMAEFELDALTGHDPIDNRIYSSSDNLHPTDWGHQLYADRIIRTIYAQYALRTGFSLPWDPRLLGNIIFRYEADRGQIVYTGDTNAVSSWTDKSTWAYDLSAAGALRPTWNAANKSVDGAGGATMTTALTADLSFASQLEAFAVYHCSSVGTIVVEYSPDYTSVANAWAITGDTAGAPAIIEKGNLGNSYAIGSSFPGMKAASLILDNTKSSGQGDVLLDGGEASVTRVDAPNTNAFGQYKLSVFGRAGGSLGSTMQLDTLIVFSAPLSSSDRSQLLSWAYNRRAQWGG